MSGAGQRADSRSGTGAASFLTVDLGNTRAKLRAWRSWGLTEADSCEPELSACASCAADAGLARAVLAFARGHEAALSREEQARFAAVGFSSVASGERTGELRAALAQHFGERLVDPLDAGLENATLEPERVGVDRLFAARAAFELVGTSVVIDVGTALTVDAVRALEPSASTPRARFEGGAIAAGPRALAEALASCGARLFAVEPEPGVPVLGRSSAGALAAGIVHGVRGTARELVSGLRDELGLDDVPVVLTGGARRFLLEPPLFDAWAEPLMAGSPGSRSGSRSGSREACLLVEPELVQRGVLAALEQACRERLGGRP